MSSSILPDLCIANPKYQKVSFGLSLWSPIRIISSSPWIALYLPKSHLSTSKVTNMCFDEHASLGKALQSLHALRQNHDLSVFRKNNFRPLVVVPVDNCDGNQRLTVALAVGLLGQSWRKEGIFHSLEAMFQKLFVRRKNSKTRCDTLRSNAAHGGAWGSGEDRVYVELIRRVTRQVGSVKNEGVDFVNALLGGLRDGVMKLRVTQVRRYTERKVNEELDLKYFLVQSAETGKKGKNGLDSLFADRILESLAQENVELFDKRIAPTRHIFLSFLYRKGYWAMLSLPDSNGSSSKGFLKPFMIHSLPFWYFSIGKKCLRRRFKEEKDEIAFLSEPHMELVLQGGARVVGCGLDISLLHKWLLCLDNTPHGSAQDSNQQKETDVNGNLADKCEGSDEHVSKIQYDELFLYHFPNSSESFFCNLPKKIQHGLEYEAADLKIVAERLVNQSIYWLRQKHETYELQILLRLEIHQSEYKESIKGSMKLKLVKQICTLLEIIQYLVEGGFRGNVSLYAYVERTIKASYSHNLQDVVDKIYDQMDLLPFGEEDEDQALMFNSEDSNQSWREKNDKHDILASKRFQESLSLEDESSHPLENLDTKLNKACERKERARRFVSFTRRMPDLQRVWPSKQSKAVKVKPENKRKKQKRGSYSVVCETLMVDQSPFIVLDLKELRSITINSSQNTTWVESGTTLGELYYWVSQQSQNLAFPGGICPTVGVGGQLSEGGFGTMVRKYGLAADNVIDARIIDVNGKFLIENLWGKICFGQLEVAGVEVLPLAVWSIAADYLVSNRYPGVRWVCHIRSWPNVRTIYGSGHDPLLDKCPGQWFTSDCKVSKYRNTKQFSIILHNLTDLLPFGEEDKDQALMFNSEDSNQSWREKNDKHDILASKRFQESLSLEDESSHPLENLDTKLNEACERRERARRFVSFTRRMPDLQRVWAPKQSKAMKVKPENKRKKQKRGSYSVVCETPMHTVLQNFGYQIRIRGGGHDYASVWYTSYDKDQSPFIVLDLKELRSITINSSQNNAWAESGTTLGELYYWVSQQSQNLSFLGGICPTVGVGGQLSEGGSVLWLENMV
uniref:Putative treslin n=1 Tax=Tanacetum cinerariifolium TaxID=118510 RepID=A0A699H0S9_TANCI|nr:putative treslin [Tanacetum cinerariifolium]